MSFQFYVLPFIYDILGEYLLKHVRNITSGRNTLLTLPRCLINKLIKYLSVQDIVKLISLSRVSKEVTEIKEIDIQPYPFCFFLPKYLDLR